MDATSEEFPADHEFSATKASCVDAETTEKTHLEAGVSCNGREPSLSDVESQAGAALAMQNERNGHLDVVPPVTESSACDDIPADITMQADGEQPSVDGTGSNANVDSEGFSQQLTWLQLPDNAGGKASKDSDRIERDVIDMMHAIVGRVANCIEDDAAVSCSSMDTDAQNYTVDVDRTTGSPNNVQVLSKTPRVAYRDNEEDTSSDSASSSSSSDSDVEVVTPMRRGAPKGDDSDCCSDGGEVDGQQRTTTKPRFQGRGGGRPRNRGIKTPGELDIDDLPPIEDLHITLPRAELRQAGRVKHAVDQLLVVESEPGQPVLDLDSVLFRADGTALGRVFDVLGPVSAPYYTVRFNTAQELTERALEPGEPVLYAPLHADVTQYVLESEVRKQRGSDASWENNNEPPPEHLDFSDDEQEREVRKQLRAARAASSNAKGTGDPAGGDQKPRGASRGRGRGRGVPRGGHNREQQSRQQQPESVNGAAHLHNEGPPRPDQFYDNRSRPQWPPSWSPQQHWPSHGAPARFRPNPPPPPSWPASPQGDNRVPNIWNTPPPSLPRPPPLPWQHGGPWPNRPPMFPDLRTPPPNFGRAVPPPSHSQAPFASPHGPHANTPTGNLSYQQAGAASPCNPNSVPSPVYNSTGQRVPLYDPVPDLQRILATPPPPQPPLRH
uniref:H/ACA ribonucleoprotein complex non-core subunit NAF1 n=1 Tax=Rhipicephalus zambeziensis TaxID=60191 RepID=A0A224YP81_9ACAR